MTTNEPVSTINIILLGFEAVLLWVLISKVE